MKKCLKKRILPILAVFVIVITATMLPISAATPDWTSYTGSNLLPYPYVDFSASSSVTSNGVTFSLRDFGLIELSGTATGGAAFYLNYDLHLPAGTYSFYSGNPVLGLAVDLYHNGSFVSTYIDDTIVVSEGDLLVVYLFAAAGRNFDNVVIYPMVNFGSRPLAYQPYIPYWMNYQYQLGLQVNGSQESFDAGFEDGYKHGYGEGYADGFDNGENVNALIQYPMDIWTRVDVTVGFINSSISPNEQFQTVSIDRSDEAAVEENKLMVNNQFSVKQIVETVLDSQTLNGNGYILGSSCTLTVYFDDSAFMPSLYACVGTYPHSTTFNVSVFNGASLLGSDKISTLGGGDSGTSGTFSYAAGFSGVGGFVNKVVVSCIGGTSIDSPQTIEEYGFTLGIVGNPNQEAYLDGLRTGSTMGYANAFDDGKTEGLAEGYDKGFLKGKEEGLQIAELGDWRSLIVSVCEVPVNTFSSLFNFEILGLDMKAAFGSILALCVVLIVVKKVLL